MAAEIINLVTSGHSLAECLPAKLDKMTDARDRAFVQALCYGVCRFYSRLDVVLSHLLTKPMKEKDSDVHALLLVGLYQLMEMQTAPHAAVSETVNAVQALKKSWARGFVNAVLREYLRQQESLNNVMEQDDEAKYAHPAWWIKALKKAWPQQWEAILQANNQHPPFSLRVNVSHQNRENYLAKLQQQELSAHVIAHTEQGIILDNPVNVEQLPAFADGGVTVQDGAAQLAATLLQLQPHQRVLDACAAPGGKLTHILELAPDAEVIAIEKESSRLAAIQENLTRLHQRAKIHCADAAKLDSWWDKKPFDKILLDAPCSASGVIRRHPDIKLLRQPADLRALQKEQYHLLTQLWQTLAPNGLLVYATCSVMPEENQNNIERFLAEHSDAVEEKIQAEWGVALSCGWQILSGMCEMDGFYYACIRKLSHLRHPAACPRDLD